MRTHVQKRAEACRNARADRRCRRRAPLTPALSPEGRGRKTGKESNDHFWPRDGDSPFFEPLSRTETQPRPVEADREVQGAALDSPCGRMSASITESFSKLSIRMRPLVA
jgi:hypothetical protein